jgi:hypothetical protein
MRRQEEKICYLTLALVYQVQIIFHFLLVFDFVLALTLDLELDFFAGFLVPALALGAAATFTLPPPILNIFVPQTGQVPDKAL